MGGRLNYRLLSSHSDSDYATCRDSGTALAIRRLPRSSRFERGDSLLVLLPKDVIRHRARSRTASHNATDCVVVASSGLGRDGHRDVPSE
jgi:hypothetical protein